MKLESINYIGDEEQQCITVSAEDGLYITNDDIITHNSVSTQYVLVFGSFSQKKGSEIYTEPMVNMLEELPFFERVRSHHILNDIDKETSKSSTIEKVYWTTATPTSILQFSNKLNVKLFSSANDIIGATILAGAITELSFFYENGWTDEKIMRLYSKLKQRISSRLHGNYYGRTVIDSSPGSLENAIDKFIWEDAPKSKTNFIASGSRWKYLPGDYPEFFDDKGEEIHSFDIAFPLFKGGNGKIPQVLENDNELSLFDPIDIVWCPKRNKFGENVLEQALENPLEFMRDFGGIPAGMQERIFYDQSILDGIFENNLKNFKPVNVALTDKQYKAVKLGQLGKDIDCNMLNKFHEMA
jgi:hypothetical protein